MSHFNLEYNTENATGVAHLERRMLTKRGGASRCYLCAVHQYWLDSSHGVVVVYVRGNNAESWRTLYLYVRQSGGVWRFLGDWTLGSPVEAGTPTLDLESLPHCPEDCALTLKHTIGALETTSVSTYPACFRQRTTVLSYWYDYGEVYKLTYNALTETVESVLLHNGAVLISEDGVHAVSKYTLKRDMINDISYATEAFLADAPFKTANASSKVVLCSLQCGGKRQLVRFKTSKLEFVKYFDAHDQCVGILQFEPRSLWVTSANADVIDYANAEVKRALERQLTN